MTLPTFETLIQSLRFERNLHSDEALLSTLRVDAQTLAAARAGQRALPNIAMAVIANSTDYDLLTVMAVSNLSLTQLSESARQFWIEQLD